MERSKSRRGKTCLASLILACLLCLLAACAPASRKPAGPLPRANPGYVQWLERQSMLAAVPEYTRVVSGTDLLWRAPVADDFDGRITTLLEAADTWLFVQAQLLLTENQRPVLVELGNPAHMRMLTTLGFGGVYMLPTMESANLWSGQNLSTTGEDASSLAFAPHVGTEKNYTDLAHTAAREHMQWGSGLVPAAIGMGPDFFLGARHVRDYPGSLMMVDIPKEFWNLLPPTAALPSPSKRMDAAPQTARADGAGTPDWTGISLTGPHAASFAALVEKNILPPVLLRDTLTWPTQGAWAATPIIEGIDGVERRFVYRYHGSVLRPVLQWDDPSKNAQRILSASIIRTIGTQQQTLGGLYPEAWVGLDSMASTPHSGAATAHDTELAEPAASALRALSREIRRYGGWSLQGEVFPAALTTAILRTGVDFTVDTITAPAAEYALLTGDTRPLKEALKTSLATGIDHKRLVRSLPHYTGLDVRPLHATPQGRDALKKLKTFLQHSDPKGEKNAWLTHAPLSDTTLHATAATLAAMSAGLSPEAAIRPESFTPILARHMLLTTFRAGMPGLLMLSGHDMVGALNVAPSPAPEAPDAPAATGATLGAWALSAPAAAALSSRTGHARAPSVYGPVSAQTAVPGSYAQQVAALTAVRKQWAVARATLIAVPDTSHTSTVALLLQVPDGSHVLTIANFSDKSRSEQLTLSGRKATDALSPAQLLSLEGNVLRLELDPWQCRLIHIN